MVGVEVEIVGLCHRADGVGLVVEKLLVAGRALRETPACAQIVRGIINTEVGLLVAGGQKPASAKA